MISHDSLSNKYPRGPKLLMVQKPKTPVPIDKIHTTKPIIFRIGKDGLG